MIDGRENCLHYPFFPLVDRSDLHLVVDQFHLFVDLYRSSDCSYTGILANDFFSSLQIASLAGNDNRLLDVSTLVRLRHTCRIDLDTPISVVVYFSLWMNRQRLLTWGC